MGAKRIMAVAALAMGLGGLWTAPAGAGDGAATQKPKLAKGDPSRRICKNIVPVGSRLTTRICRTKAEWDASMDKTQDGVLQTQMTTTTGMQPDPRPN